MRTQPLGRSGLQVSIVGLGCNNFGKRSDLEESRAVVHAALDHGITLFDTADSYGGKGGSETYLGQILGERRKDIVLATKFGRPMDHAGILQGGSRRYVISAVEASLKRLKTDWIDLYQMHYPDASTPIEETLRALDDLVHAGKIRYIGCSNFAAWAMVDAHWTAKTHNLHRFISHQDEYSLLNRDIEKDLLPAARAKEIGLLPFFPLAGGLLTGKYKSGEAAPPGTRLGNNPSSAQRFMTDRNLTTLDALQDFVSGKGRSMLDLAFSWLLARGASSVIAGATRPEQIAANVNAAGWQLTAEDLAEIDRLTTRPAA